MKKLDIITVKLTSTFLIVLISCSIAYPQAILNKPKSLSEVAVKAKRVKLPNTQKVSMRAPAKVRIDGKGNEWVNKFQAYNHATDIFYTLCNDDDNLYLVIKAVEPGPIRKILGGGVTFTIQKSLKNDDKNAVSITYPTYNILKEEIGISVDLHTNENIDTLSKDVKKIQQDHNKQIGEMCGLIRVTGIEGLDTLISAYNNDGVMAAGMFDIKEAYTFELRIALKRLSLSANDAARFAYHIKLNGLNPFGDTAPTDFPGKPPLAIDRSMFAGAVTSRPSAPKSMGYFIKWASTDFWAEYTLAKK